MIELDRRDGVVTMRLAHGPVNALDADLLDAFADALQEVAAERPRALILTGSGSAFSAGANLKRVLEEDAAYRGRGIASLSRAFLTLFVFERPVVAAINGHAIAGGCVVAGACDRRIMARGPGRIGLAELAVGVPFPLAALEIMRFAVGGRAIEELVYFAELFDADDARARGLIDEAVDAEQLTARAAEAADRLARIPADTFTHTKRALRQPVLDRLYAHAQKADEEAARVWGSDEVIASIRAFMAAIDAR